MNPVMIRRFQKARQKLKEVRGEKMSYPVLAFHGTKETNIHSICDTGFRVPGEANFEHATDIGNNCLIATKVLVSNTVISGPQLNICLKSPPL